MTRLQVFSTGVSLELAVRVRRGTLPMRDLHEALWSRGGRESPALLIGVELPDGRRANNLGRMAPADELVFTQGGGSGNELSVDQGWWLSPLPPEGPLRFVVSCAALGIEETSTVLDGAAIQQAAADVVTLWPWSPPEPDSGPPPPDIPENSWFAGSP